MKRKGLAFILGAIGVLSIGAISFSHKPLKVSAATDVGAITFTSARSESTNHDLYLVPEGTNSIPTAWGSGDYDCAYTATSSGAALINGVDAGNVPIKKVNIGAIVYHVNLLTNVSPGDVVKLSGSWSGTSSNGTTYNFSINTFSLRWSGTTWLAEYDLEPYDTVTLVSASFDDLDRIAFDYFKAPSAWNTYTTSASNARNSFAFVFNFEAYGKMTDSLQIRVGTSGNYDGGHFYRLDVNNTWNETAGGVIKMLELNGSTTVRYSPDFPQNLQAGSRHVIEFGSIYIKNSNKTFDYIKCDGEYGYQEVVTPYNDNRTTKVSLYYGGNNIFVGSALDQKNRDTTLSFNRTNENKGIYLNGPVNDIPVDGWNVKGVPASKYNALLNGQPMYQYGTEAMPLAKHSEESEDNYYIDFDSFSINFSEGDVVTLSDEYHFYYNNKAYTLSLNPISFLFSNGEFSPINDIYDYMYNSLSNRCDLELYSDEDIALINEIVADAQSSLPLRTNMKRLWDLYLNYINQLDSIDLDEEKAAEILGPARENAIEELQNYYDPEIYDEEHQAIIEEYLAIAIANINACKSIGEINQIVVNTKTQIDAVPTKQTVIEEAIMDSDTLLNQYLETYDVITTSDLCTTGDMLFNADSSYSSGDLKDVTTRFSTSLNNLDGNLIFQFNYRSTNPNSRKYDAQVFIRVRGTDDNCARFDIGGTFSSRSGVRLVVNNALIEDYDANLQANTTYKMECGSIDLDGFNRSLIFIRINGEFVIKHIVDQVAITQTPTVRIMDSYTTGSDTVTLSPVEDGTTKVDHAKIIGNLDLDPESTSNSLIVDMRKNDISNGTLLYPMEDGAFSINDQQVPCYRPEVSLTKMNATQYAVNFDYSTLRNGSVVKLTGVFCSHDPARGLKKAYRLFEASFVYQNGTWSQTEPSLSDAIRDAKEMLNSYTDEVNYSESSWLSIQNIINTYVTQLDNASTVDNVKTLLNTALNLIDAVPTLLQDYQAEAKALLQAFSELHEYREDEQIELATILEEAFIEINNAEDYDEIDQIVNNAKVDIDSLKTTEERDLEDLEAEKRVAKTEVEVYTGLLEMNRYSQENINLIRTLAFTARDDIESASSIEEIESIVSTFKEAIKNIKTNDGSVFNGETYVEPGSDSNNGCGGNIMTTSILLSILSLFGLLVILGKKHYLMFNNK